MRSPLAALAICVSLVVAPSAAAQTTEPNEVLRSEPYYLGLYEAEPPSQGTVLLIHGGGWLGDKGPAADDEMRPYIDALVSWGYDVANLGYRTGEPGLADALDAFDVLRDRLGPRERICIFGGSAGGHLALTVAAKRGRSVDCVVDFLGPPDLTAWGTRPGAALGRNLAVEAFGEERLAELSPINMVQRIDAPVLVVAAPCDVFIELSDQERFVDALNAAGGLASLQVVEAGDEIPLGHCNVERASYVEFLEVARRFLAGKRVPGAGPPEGDGSNVGALLLIAVAAAGAIALLGWRLRRRA